MIGKTLSNRYKLIAQLANGGMAWVYLAQDLVAGQRVAVKVLYPQLGQDLSFVQRFTQEAKLVMSLCQAAPEQHIVRVLDYGSDQEVHYLVMEYVEGRDLRQMLEEEGALMWREALDIARQVTLALEHAYQHGIVHRDIKPANIMVLADGTVRILDFGVARARTSPTLTHSGFVGSPSYVAPEQAMGRSVDVRVDIYSLGIVLYEMLTRRTPFDADTPLAILMKHLRDPLPLPRQVSPDIPESLERAVLKALAKGPEDRYQSAREMARALGEAAVEAGIELPERISQPLSFTTDEAPSESVAVLSGTARQRLAEVQFADEDTDPTLARRLAAETVVLALVGWIVGILLSRLSLYLIDWILFAPRGHDLTVTWAPIILIIPIPISVIAFTLLSARRTLSRLDAVSIVEQGELGLQNGLQRKATTSQAKPLSSLTFFKRHKRRTALLTSAMSLVIVAIALLIFVFAASFDALEARLGDLHEPEDIDLEHSYGRRNRYVFQHAP